MRLIGKWEKKKRQKNGKNNPFPTFWARIRPKIRQSQTRSAKVKSDGLRGCAAPRPMSNINDKRENGRIGSFFFGTRYLINIYLIHYFLKIMILVFFFAAPVVLIRWWCYLFRCLSHTSKAPPSSSPFRSASNNIDYPLLSSFLSGLKSI